MGLKRQKTCNLKGLLKQTIKTNWSIVAQTSEHFSDFPYATLSIVVER